MKDKQGNKITSKEFFSKWADGIKNLTLMQKMTNEARGTLITLIGFIVAVITLIIYRDRLIVSWFAYGLILVFIGNIWTTGIKWLSLNQQLKYFKNINQSSDDIHQLLNNLNEEVVERRKNND